MTAPELVCTSCGADMTRVFEGPQATCPVCAARVQRYDARHHLRRMRARQGRLGLAMIALSQILLILMYVFVGRAQDLFGGHALWFIAWIPSVPGWFVLLRSRRTDVGAAWWLLAAVLCLLWAVVATVVASAFLVFAIGASA